MSKGKRNKDKRKIETAIKADEFEKKNGGKKMMWIPIVISLLSLIISCYMAYLQFTYSDAEYKYKIDPVFNITAGLSVETVPKGEDDHISIPSLERFHVEIISENNIEKLYLISPEKEVHEIKINDEVEKQVNEYFEDQYESGEPDLLIGENRYYYRFLVYKGIDDHMEIKTLYAKLNPLTRENDRKGIQQIEFVDEIKMLEFEKGYPGDPNHDGEKKIAKEYRELEEYYQKYL